MSIIFHIDVDSFFVSAHSKNDKSLLKKPVVVSGGTSNSIIVSASYEAKDKGVYIPMSFAKAKELVPNLINVLPNFDLYSLISKKIMNILKSYTNKVEIGSIDEWYLDVSNICLKEKNIFSLASKIQKQIMDELEIPVSIGVGKNKFVAKMSTSLNKPYGITITKPNEFKNNFWHFPIEEYYGIGKATAFKLKNIDIFTIGDLANASFEKIEPVLGKMTNHFIFQANGEGNNIVNPESNELKSIGNSKTYIERKLIVYKDIVEEIIFLVKKISIRAKIKNFVGKVLRFEIQNNYSKRVSKQITLERKTNDFETLFQVALKLFENLWEESQVKFLGVSLNKLTKIFDYKYQGSIFDNKKNKSKAKVIIDQVNQKFGKETVLTGRKLALTKNEQISKYFDEDE